MGIFQKREYQRWMSRFRRFVDHMVLCHPNTPSKCSYMPVNNNNKAYLDLSYSENSTIQSKNRLSSRTNYKKRKVNDIIISNIPEFRIENLMISTPIDMHSVKCFQIVYQKNNRWSQQFLMDSTSKPLSKYIKDLSEEDTFDFISISPIEKIIYNDQISSGIFMDLPNKGYLILDCGKGSVQQSVQKYGVEGTIERLSRLKLVWLSHSHTDHHIVLYELLRICPTSIGVRSSTYL